MSFAKPDARVLLSLGLLLPAITQAADVLSPPVSGNAFAAIAHAAPGTAPEQRGTLPPVQAKSSPDPEQAEPQPAAAPQPPAEPIAGLGQSIAADTLDQHRGGTSVNAVSSEAVSNGLLQDATAANVGTGTNSIADGAFSHASGLPIVIQNSGANVLIQNSTIVNVQFR